MRKRFNDTGLCVPSKHFMVDTSPKLRAIMNFIDYGAYFTMNRPRQFGKTTTAFLLWKELENHAEYLHIKLSFEVSDKDSFENEAKFSQYFLGLFEKAIKTQKKIDLFPDFQIQKTATNTFEKLSILISQICEHYPKKIVLSIDEVDKASNNYLFMQFLALLRDKYLAQNQESDISFHSVILLGVHDIKNLKRKLRPEDEHSLNSPWNIAADFTVDMSFNPEEIQTMLQQYVEETNTEMDIPKIAERLHYYTAGYPYLVSKMCKVIDEIIIPEREVKNWTLADVEVSFRYLVNPSYTTTLFDDLAKNLNNNQDLYNLVFEIIINGLNLGFNIGNPIISIAGTYGILKPENGICKIHNRIFEKRVYDMMLSIKETKDFHKISTYGQFERKNQLLLEKILLKFQEFMQENYSKQDTKFLEREGRLLFLSFLKPILNGKGFDFKEPVVGNERRMDLVITYFEQKYVLELKIWRGEEYHQEGLQQLSDYLDLYNLKEGYLLIYDFRKNKEYKKEEIKFKDKEIFAVWV